MFSQKSNKCFAPTWLSPFPMVLSQTYNDDDDDDDDYDEAGYCSVGRASDCRNDDDDDDDVCGCLMMYDDA